MVVSPQILIPWVCTDHEIDLVTPGITAAALSVCAHAGPEYTLENLEFFIGSVMETPRACIRSDSIAAAEHVDFVSFGTGELTQLVFGLSEEDTQQFMVSGCFCV